MKRGVLFVLGVLWLLSAAFAPASAEAGSREISGERAFTGETVLPAGESWTVAPGAVLKFRGGRLVVRGRLLVEGSAERPVRILADASFEGVDFRGGDGSRIANALFSGGRRGVTVTGARVALRGVRFERGAIGLEIGQYGRAEVRDCVFDSHERAGILVKRGGALDVSGSRFSGARRSGIYVYGAGGVSVRGCRFEKNEAGLQASMYGASVTVADSVFAANGTGILVEKMAVPTVSGCELTGNKVGLRFSRRAEGAVSNCTIADNGDGVLVEYSSYPVFRGNRFRKNREYAVRLNHQSSQWEGEAGEEDRDAPGGPGAPVAGSGGRSDFRPGGEGASAGRPAAKKGKLDGTVDFRDNDWGDGGVEKGGAGGKRAIRDAADEPFFDFKGKRYKMDRIAY
jgi:parallel beta-helix repeat protein